MEPLSLAAPFPLAAGSVIWAGATRGQEIQAWLDAHPRRPFVILDDDSDMGDLWPHHVLCSFRCGLTMPLAMQARDALLAATPATRSGAPA